MTKKEIAIAFIDNLFENYMNQPGAIMLTDEYSAAKEFWENYKQSQNTPTKKFTDTGRLILSFLQTYNESNEESTNKHWTAKSLAESMEISSRTVSGAMRKLCADGYVNNLGGKPVTYTVTEKGLQTDLNED